MGCMTSKLANHDSNVSQQQSKRTKHKRTGKNSNSSGNAAGSNSLPEDNAESREELSQMGGRGGKGGKRRKNEADGAIGGSGSPMAQQLANGQDPSNPRPADALHRNFQDRLFSTALSQNNKKLSESQVEFFRVLDQKVAQGKDYESGEETR